MKSPWKIAAIILLACIAFILFRAAIITIF